MPPPNLRILHLVARSQRRGAEVVARELAAELDRRGHENRVVALGPGIDGSIEPELPPLAASTGMGPRDLVSRVRAVRRLLADDPFDVVFAHGGWAAQVSALAAPRSGPLLVWQRIGAFPPAVWQASRTWWWRRVARRFDVIVALTAALEAEVRGLGYQGPVWVIPNFRRSERFAHIDRLASSARLRTELGVGENTQIIGFVGHLDRNKRPELAIDVLGRVLTSDRPVHLVIAGDGVLRQVLEAEVRERGLQGSVTFLGDRDDVESVLGGTELLLITSDSEGVPGVAIEALMAGCPVVSYPVGGIAEVVEDGVTGVVVARPEPALMATEVRTLLDDDEQRLRMGRAARLRTDRFSAAVVAQKYADALLDVLGAR